MTIAFSVEAAIIVLAYSMVAGFGLGMGLIVPFILATDTFVRNILPRRGDQ